MQIKIKGAFQGKPGPIFRENPSRRYVTVPLNYGQAARGCVFSGAWSGQEVCMPRVLLGDKFYPLVAVLVFAIIIVDTMLIWTLF
jgi:hypothetical protein